MRLDQYLFENGFVPSRERAKALVMAGLVYLNDDKAEKPGQQVPENARVELRGADLRYVSRGGLKLEKAMEIFPINLAQKVCMDIGASTGGFTDCMLQNGAAKIYAVDVGYGQLAWKLRQSEQVVVMERCNIRHLNPDSINEPIEFFSIDVSFISVKHIFPVLRQVVDNHSQGVCLIKPQFEAGKENVGKNGVVRDPKVHTEVLLQASSYAAESGFHSLDVDFSPIKGPKGNIEFLLFLQRKDDAQSLLEIQAQNIVQKAQNHLQGA